MKTDVIATILLCCAAVAQDCRTPPSENQIAGQIAILRTGDEDARANALQSLIKIGDDAMEPLATLSADRTLKMQIRRMAVYGIGQIGSKKSVATLADMPAIELHQDVENALADCYPKQPAAVLDVIAAIKNPGSRQALFAKLGPTATEPMEDRIIPPDGTLNRSAIELLLATSGRVQTSPRIKSCIYPLQPQRWDMYRAVTLRRAADRRHERVITIIGRETNVCYTEDDDVVIEWTTPRNLALQLLRYLDDVEAGIRLQTVQLLAEKADGSRVTIMALEFAAKDRDENVRAAAHAALTHSKSNASANK